MVTGPMLRLLGTDMYRVGSIARPSRIGAKKSPN